MTGTWSAAPQLLEPGPVQLQEVEVDVVEVDVEGCGSCAIGGWVEVEIEMEDVAEIKSQSFFTQVEMNYA